MNVTCAECQSVFRVDPAKVPPGGVRARCSVCGAVIRVGMEETVPANAARGWDATSRAAIESDSEAAPEAFEPPRPRSSSQTAQVDAETGSPTPRSSIPFSTPFAPPAQSRKPTPTFTPGVVARARTSAEVPTPPAIRRSTPLGSPVVSAPPAAPPVTAPAAVTPPRPAQPTPPLPAPPARPAPSFPTPQATRPIAPPQVTPARPAPNFSPSAAPVVPGRAPEPRSTVARPPLIPPAPPAPTPSAGNLVPPARPAFAPPVPPRPAMPTPVRPPVRPAAVSPVATVAPPMTPARVSPVAPPAPRVSAQIPAPVPAPPVPPAPPRAPTPSVAIPEPAPRPTASAGGVRRGINPFLNNDPNQKGRRLARALVSDMIAYQPGKREEGLANGTLKEIFREEIKKSYEEYVDQIGKEFAESTTHFADALNDLLAGGAKMF